MADWLIGRAGTLYLAAFLGGFGAVALWETWRPLRRGGESRLAARWFTNIALSFINQTAMHLVLPLLGFGAALLAQQRGFGLLNLVDAPAWLAVPAAMLGLDALRWALHRALHRWPLLWRLHRVHHSDLDYDCTIGLRFHPLEALLTQGVLVLAIGLLGLPPIAVLLSDVLTIAHGYFAHGNVGLPARWDGLVRRVVVTPDLHRVHHSARLEESMSNYGSVLCVWDRLAGCCREQADGGATGMQIGLAEEREPRRLGLARLLVMPLRR
ncbi:sterol desaturase family protein [Aquabacterium humicola]|uniref:sterol desaturase family protein n=1 Tax=Aquabacterium humicola TaxID=3237377 RepID=UPI0025432014|nr:sterol desaturase family protein [Rubrivivax pictus]